MHRTTPVTPEARSLCASLETVNHQLREDDSARRTLFKTPISDDVLTGWRTVDALQEWRLDGVALGVETEENESQLVHVAVGGVCRQVVDVFGGRRQPREELFVGLVATTNPGSPTTPYSFEYVPFGGGLLHDIEQQTALGGGEQQHPHPLMRLDKHGRTGMSKLVGAWRLGSVVDTAAVRFDDHKTDSHERNVSVLVAVEFMDFMDLKRRHPCNEEIARSYMSTAYQIDCKVFNWPSENPDTDKPEDPDEEDINNRTPGDSAPRGAMGEGERYRDRRYWMDSVYRKENGLDDCGVACP